MLSLTPRGCCLLQLDSFPQPSLYSTMISAPQTVVTPVIPVVAIDSSFALPAVDELPYSWMAGTAAVPAGGVCGWRYGCDFCLLSLFSGLHLQPWGLLCWCDMHYRTELPAGLVLVESSTYRTSIGVLPKDLALRLLHAADETKPLQTPSGKQGKPGQECHTFVCSRARWYLGSFWDNVAGKALSLVLG